MFFKIHFTPNKAINPQGSKGLLRVNETEGKRDSIQRDDIQCDITLKFFKIVVERKAGSRKRVQQTKSAKEEKIA